METLVFIAFFWFNWYSSYKMKSGDYMNYYFFKLNLSWQTLRDYDGDKNHLINEVVPDSIKLVYDIEKSMEFDKYRIFLGNISSEEFYDDFRLLERRTKKLERMYEAILESYVNTGSISYSKKFLDLNELCKRTRRGFQNKYILVKEGLTAISDQVVQDKFSLNFLSQVGTGIAHIRNFYKLKMYIEELQDGNMFDQSGFEVYYDCKKEQLVVKAAKESEAVSCIQTIEKELNSSDAFIAALGEININPIYSSIEFTKKFSSIEFTLVYPNGVAPNERFEAIMESSKAKKQKIKLIGEDDNSLDMDFILQALNDQATKGYLEDVTKSVVKKIVKRSANYLF